MKLHGYQVYSEILKAQSSQVKKNASEHMSFSDVLQNHLKSGLQETRKSLEMAEHSMLQAASGASMDPLRVVHDASQAELNFELATTLRDKFIQIYQDISRMPV